VKKVLEEDYLGEIVEAEIRFERYNPELSPKAWKENGNPGASILMDLGSHVIDQALTLFGNPEKFLLISEKYERIRRLMITLISFFIILINVSD
jgi:predicted dehydrogenase